MLTGAQLGVKLVVLTPEGYGVDEQIIEQASKIANENNCTLTITTDVNELGNVDAIYADTWISMGDGKSLEQIINTFKPYQITKDLMQSANAKYFLHCQPAHRDEEVTAQVLDSEQSVILRQAENRMWAQNALLHTLLVK
jgi:ornithine carbamoyltransferase